VPPEVKEELGQAVAEQMRVWVAAVLVVVTTAVELARAIGESGWLIGLTVVGVGTSLSELAAAVAGAVRGEADIVLGNVAGSNLFNVLLILGTTAVSQPMGVPARRRSGGRARFCSRPTPGSARGRSSRRKGPTRHCNRYPGIATRPAVATPGDR
jgi:hypothetical protein